MRARRYRADTRRAPARPERGAVAVEFALVLPVLAMLLLGVLTAGITISNGIGLSNAVREGSRFAATTAYPPTSGNWADDVITRTRATQFDDPASSTRICVDLYKQGTGSLQSKCDPATSSITGPATFVAPAGTPPTKCVVRVWAARRFTINAVLVRFENRVMTRQAVAMYERTTC